MKLSLTRAGIFLCKGLTSGRMTFTACIATTLFIIQPSSAAAPDDTINLQFSFPEPLIESMGRYSRVSMGDLPTMKAAGQPALPFKPVRILIPRGRKVASLEVAEGEMVTLDGRYLIEPAPQPVPLDYNGPPIVTAPDGSIYNSRSPFPAETKADVTDQFKGPFRLLLVNLNPVRYIPARGELSYYTSLTVTVRLENASRITKLRQARRPRHEEEESIRQKVENPQALSTYRESGMALRAGGPLGDYPHVIITSPALADESGPYSFQSLRDHRTAHGMNSTIVTTDYIYANFDGHRPDGGSDNQTKIRNFISWAHTNWGTEYVLLGGYSGIIPVRYLSADGTNIPADMYYGCLDGTFDNDADGTYGEPTDGPGGGEVDLYAEVYVGRACVENAEEMANFVRKTISYETSSSDYLHLAYMLGEHLGFGGDSEYAKPSMEEIRLGSSAHGYTTEGFDEHDFFQTETLYDADGTWSKSQLISIMNAGVHILNHLGHANYTYDMKLYTSDLSSLTNTDYFFSYSQGCNPGGFDTSNCFAETITTMEHGAFAAVMNARSGWGTYNSTAGPSQYYDREFWDALFGEDIKALGRINADSKEDNDFRIGGSRMRWCYYELNLFGDPATEIRNISSRGRVSFDADAYPIPGTVTITVTDLDLDTNPASPDTAIITITSDTESVPETVTLTESGASTKTFRGSIPIAEGAPMNGDGILQVADGDTLNAVYHDTDDGTGSAADVQDTAEADGSPPVISNIQSVPSATSCIITWETDEVSDSLVRYGVTSPPSEEVADSSLTTSHSMRIRGLEPLTPYYFEVASADSVGNSTADNNGGSYHQFTTRERAAILFVDDDEGDAYESYFTNALDEGSYGYDVWDVNYEGLSPAFADLDGYQVVIWNCGYNYSASTSGLTASEQDALSQYMDNGGSLFLCGQDILHNGVSSGFRTDYLHLADYAGDDITVQAIGIDNDRISDSISLALIYPFSNWSDSLNPDPSSSGVFQTDGGTSYPYCSTRYPADGVAGTFKIVFFAFPFESISAGAADPHNSKTVMDRVIQFLSPIEVEEISPAYGLNDRSTNIMIHGASFKDGLAVTVGNAALGTSSVTAARIEATVPAGLAPGLYDCTVRNPDSLRASLGSCYTALDPASDSDQDGLTNEEEVVVQGTNPLVSDTDGDALSDGDEVGYGTNPLSPDTDGDGLTDYEEVNYNSSDGGYNPYDPDTNPTGTDTDARESDTDGDGFSDSLEMSCGSNPLDSLATPQVISINFQPSSSSRTTGYAADSGSSFNGCGYGWR